MPSVHVELRSGFGHADSMAVSPPQWPTIERRGDLDGDGELGLDDVFLLLDAMEDRSRIHSFDAFDLDGDGQLARGDIDALLGHLPV